MNECEPRIGVDCYQFQLTGVGAHVNVTSAHLWLYKTRDVIGHHFSDAIVSDRNQTITVTQTSAPRSGRPSRRRSLASVNVRRRSGCWVRVDIHRAVLDQVEGGRRRSRSVPALRLAVECRGGCVLARGRGMAVGGADRRPVLVVGTVETNRRRRRRTLGSSCPPSRCCLHRLYVNFARIGWRFIREPPGYWINYCHGPCRCKLSHDKLYDKR